MLARRADAGKVHDTAQQHEQEHPSHPHPRTTPGHPNLPHPPPSPVSFVRSAAPSPSAAEGDKLDVTPSHDHSYIHMNDSTSHQGDAYSTLSTNDLALMQTIGIKRGADLLRSRPAEGMNGAGGGGGGGATAGATAGGGKGTPQHHPPPSGMPDNRTQMYQQREGSRSIPNFEDAREAGGNDRGGGGLPPPSSSRMTDLRIKDGHGIIIDDDDDDDDQNYGSDIDLYPNALPGNITLGDTSLAGDILKNDSQFYMLQSGGGGVKGGAGGASHILSSEALAGECEVECCCVVCLRIAVL